MTKLYKPYAVQESSTTSGTLDFVLGGAEEGFRAFGSAVEDNSRFTYYAKHDAFDQWEVGEGTYNQAGNSLIRTGAIRAGSNGLSKVNFSSGDKTISLVDDNYAANLIVSGRFDALSEAESDLPDASDGSVIAAGRRAVAGAAGGIAIGDDSISGTGDEVIAIGKGAQAVDVDRSIVIGRSASCRVTGTANPYSSVAIGDEATCYSRGMHAFSAGGAVSTDLVRLSGLTTSTSPVILEMDISANNGDTSSFKPTADGRTKTLGFEVYVVGATIAGGSGAFYQKFSLCGYWDGANFVQAGATVSGTAIESGTLVGSTIAVAIVNEQVEVTVTAPNGLTNLWGASIIAASLFHAGVLGSGV